MEGAPPGANQIDLFMHFLGASRDGLVARRVDLDTISSSDIKEGYSFSLVSTFRNVIIVSQSEGRCRKGGPKV
jgi:hypothetical protein